jgi:predicted nucleic acid-binding protein
MVNRCRRTDWRIRKGCAASGESPVKALIDTNVLIDYLHGIAQAQAELALYEDPSISVISWMEVMAGTTDETEAATRAFLRSFNLVPIDGPIAERAVVLRRTRRLKLPDAIIAAAAQANACLLVTRNSRDFDARDPGIRVPYII